MANEKPITMENVALTEKKVDMSLDEIIRMSKSDTNLNKGKNQRASNKKGNFHGPVKNSAVKAQRYMGSRSDVRQGAFAKRRSNFQGNQFPVTTTIARKAASGTPIRGRPYNAGRMTNTNQSRSRPYNANYRFITPPVQNKFARRGFVAKKQQQPREMVEQTQANGGGQRQWPQTLDSRFANMKEERMRVRRFANNRSNVGYNGVGFQQQQQQHSMFPYTRRTTRFLN